MAFTDPQALTIAGATKNLVRVDSGKYQSEYVLNEATQSFRMLVRSSDLKKEVDGRYKVRHNISLRQTIFATSTTPEIVRSTFHTIEHYAGDVVTDFDDISLAVSGVASAANILKLNNYES